MSLRFSPVRDTTANQHPGGGGMPIMRLALCGHKTNTTGAKMRGRLVLLCAACNKARAG